MSAIDKTIDGVWSPILDGESNLRAWAIIHRIARNIPNSSLISDMPPGLADGFSGLALFYHNLSIVDPNQKWSILADIYYNNAIESISSSLLLPSLYTGFPGIAWLMSQITHDCPDGHLEDVDYSILDYVSRSPWCSHYDVISGLVGLGMYGLSRLPSRAGVEIVSAVIDRLDEVKIARGQGFTWHTDTQRFMFPRRQRELWPHGYYNLGLAHGIPCIIAFLSRAYEYNISTNKCLSLVCGATEWLFEQENPGNMISRFGTLIPVPESQIREESGIGWCYGDLGIAASLLVSARSTKNTGLEDKALRIAYSVATRSINNQHASDACFCHGAAGNAHIFNRIYQSTRDETYKQAASAWYNRVLDLYTEGSVGCGFLHYAPRDDKKNENPWIEEINFLNGAAGIALALLAGVSSEAPDWDSFLLVNAKPISAGPTKT